jgi:tRNA(fMet)-specific endonuclease VapC
MSRYILDTNHLRAYEDLQPNVMAKINAIGIQNIALTVITVEEQAQGWLKAIKFASQAPLPKRAEKFQWAYSGLKNSVQMVNQFELLEFPIAAYDRFLDFRRQGIRISTNDLQIAAIAIEVGQVVVTRNLRDFEQVPGLQLENWFQD